MVILLESCLYFRVIYLVESYPRLYFSIIAYAFLRIYKVIFIKELYLFKKRFEVMVIRTFYTVIDFMFIRNLSQL